MRKVIQHIVEFRVAETCVTRKREVSVAHRLFGQKNLRQLGRREKFFK